MFTRPTQPLHCHGEIGIRALNFGDLGQEGITPSIAEDGGAASRAGGAVWVCARMHRRGDFSGGCVSVHTGAWWWLRAPRPLDVPVPAADGVARRGGRGGRLSSAPAAAVGRQGQQQAPTFHLLRLSAPASPPHHPHE